MHMCTLTRACVKMKERVRVRALPHLTVIDDEGEGEGARTAAPGPSTGATAYASRLCVADRADTPKNGGTLRGGSPARVGDVLAIRVWSH